MARSRREDLVWWATVEEALADLTVDKLKRLAALVCTAVPKRKPRLVALLADQLEGERLGAVWERLGELDRAAVAEVVHGPERRFDAERFRAKYGGDPDWGARDDWGRHKAGSLLCLFIYQGVIPDDLLARLEPLVPTPPEPSIDTLEELPAAIERRGERYDYEARKRESLTETIPLVACDRERAASDELAAVLRLIDSGKVAVSDKTRRPTSAAVRAVTAVLGEGDFYDDEEIGPIRAFAWPLLVQAAGLAERAGARLRLTAAGRRALVEPAAPALRRAWERWLETRLLDELGRIDAIKGQNGKGKRGLTALAGRREAIADALADCPVGRWIAVDELFRYMRASGRDFEVTRDAWRLYLSEPNYGSLGYDGCGGWEILQARYALCVLFEYAATLGVIDVAYVSPVEAREDFRELWGADELEFLSRYDGLSHVRLSSLGAYCLGIADSYQPLPIEVRPVLSVLATLEIAVTEESLAAADRIVLERYAERTSEQVWRLTAERLLAALEAGGSLTELSEFLAARSATALPEPVARLLADLQQRAGRLEDGGAARLIECGDAALATLVANHARTRRLCLLAGERHIVVPAASERAFSRALRELGYPLPASELRDAA
jgi:hypothetical protein